LKAIAFRPLAALALIFGIFYVGLVALLPAAVTDDFGGRAISGIIGLSYTSVALGTLIGPSLAGWAFDLSGSYTLPILVSLVTNIVAGAAIIATGHSRSPMRSRR
jgi:hypothetical protein